MPSDDDDFLRVWTTDAHGRKVRVGLTAEETAEYERCRDQQVKERPEGRAPDRKAAARFLELYDKYERAQREVVIAEVELRADPTIN